MQARALALSSAIGASTRWSQREAVSGPDPRIGREGLGCPDTKERLASHSKQDVGQLANNSLPLWPEGMMPWLFTLCASSQSLMKPTGLFPRKKMHTHTHMHARMQTHRHRLFQGGQEVSSDHSWFF